MLILILILILALVLVLILIPILILLLLLILIRNNRRWKLLRARSAAAWRREEVARPPGSGDGFAVSLRLFCGGGFRVQDRV